MWLEGIAWAQVASSSGAPQSTLDQILTSPALPIALIFGVMYFIFIRPQTKKASDHQKMLTTLKRNDEVVTTGGLVGRIAELGDRVVTLEIAKGVNVRVERNQIAALSTYGKVPKKDSSQ